VDIKIDEAGSRDLPAITALLAQLYPPGRQAITGQRVGAIHDQMARYPNYRVYVARLNTDGSIVGMYSLLIMDTFGRQGLPAAIVEDVVVATEHRRKGVGRAMMLEVLAQARAAGCYKISLSSNLNREEAHRFYESLGFRKHGHSYQVDLEG
jgi:GNAT superfamily N-acetyltransferase